MNIYGVRGYPTPDYTSESICRTFRIPNSTLALGAFMGALWNLADSKMWQEYGDMTPEESASMFQDIFWSMFEENIGICPELGAPYWDTAANVDDEFPEEIPHGLIALDVPTVWFGELKVIDGNLTWVENLYIWAIAGFIAYAGQPGAAIAFVPFAQRFVLAFKAHDLGGIIRVFIDGELVDVIDSYQPSASIITRDIYTDNSGDPHDLWVEMSEDVNPAVDGEPFIQVVRKELDENQVSPRDVRYYPTTDTVQSDYDHDGVWEDNPPLDVRHNDGYRFPPIDADDPKCQAAANMTRWVSDFLNEVGTTLSWATVAEGSLTTIMGAIALVFPEAAAVGVFALLGLDLATTIFSAGLTAIQAAFDNDTLDLMTCIFYCDIESDGTVTADDLVTISTDVGEQLNTLAALVLQGMFLLMGEVGLSNAGARGDAPADCDGCACGWCFQFNDTHQLADWTPLGWAGSPDTLPVYGDGVWNSGYFNNGGHNGNYVHIRYVFDTTIHITLASAFSEDMPDNRNLWVNGDGSLFSGTRVWNNGTWEGGDGVDIDSIDAIFWRNIDQGVNPFVLNYVQLSGDADVNPIGDDNC